MVSRWMTESVEDSARLGSGLRNENEVEKRGMKGGETVEEVLEVVFPTARSSLHSAGAQVKLLDQIRTRDHLTVPRLA